MPTVQSILVSIGLNPHQSTLLVPTTNPLCWSQPSPIQSIGLNHHHSNLLVTTITNSICCSQPPPIQYVSHNHHQSNQLATTITNPRRSIATGIDAFEGTVQISAVALSPKQHPHPIANSGDVQSNTTSGDVQSNANSVDMQLSVKLPPGPGARQWFTLPDSTWAQLLAGTHVLTSTVLSRAGDTASHHVILGTPPKDLRLANATVSFVLDHSARSDGTYGIAVTADEVIVPLCVSIIRVYTPHSMREYRSRGMLHVHHNSR